MGGAGRDDAEPALAHSLAAYRLSGRRNVGMAGETLRRARRGQVLDISATCSILEGSPVPKRRRKIGIGLVVARRVFLGAYAGILVMALMMVARASEPTRRGRAVVPLPLDLGAPPIGTRLGYLTF
jgi:hypothetical protein